MSRVLLAALLAAPLAAAAPSARADDMPVEAMIDRFVEYVYTASPRDQHGLDQLAWLLRHCAQPLCDKLEHQIHSRKATGSTATVLAVTQAGPGQWDADFRLDTGNVRGNLPVVMLRATLLVDANGRVSTFLSNRR